MTGIITAIVTIITIRMLNQCSGQVRRNEWNYQFDYYDDCYDEYDNDGYDNDEDEDG